MSRAAELKKKIAALQGVLDRLEPYETMSVREIAKKSGISPATAHRFVSGKNIDLKTARALINSDVVYTCPCCGQMA